MAGVLSHCTQLLCLRQKSVSGGLGHVVGSGITDPGSTLHGSAFCQLNFTTKGLLCPPLGPEDGAIPAQDTNTKDIAAIAVIIALRFVALTVVRIFTSLPLHVVVLLIQLRPSFAVR